MSGQSGQLAFKHLFGRDCFLPRSVQAHPKPLLRDGTELQQLGARWQRHRPGLVTLRTTERQLQTAIEVSAS
jgi:hypothetical protein